MTDLRRTPCEEENMVYCYNPALCESLLYLLDHRDDEPLSETERHVPQLSQRDGAGAA